VRKGEEIALRSLDKTRVKQETELNTLKEESVLTEDARL